MKKLKKCGESNHNCKQTKKCLSAIEALIKAEPYRELGSEKLNELDPEILCPEHLVIYHYLNGRYHFYKFKEQEDIEHLEWANDYFDDMVSLAYDKKVKIEDERYFYSRAYVKYKLAELIWDEERKPWLLKKASDITTKALINNPSNDSFIWLNKRLSA